MNPETLIGWKLHEAREVLSQTESTRALSVQVVETYAPVKKVDLETQRFGDWRVLRAREINPGIELTVAREQIVD